MQDNFSAWCYFSVTKISCSSLWWSYWLLSLSLSLVTWIIIHLIDLPYLIMKMGKRLHGDVKDWRYEIWQRLKIWNMTKVPVWEPNWSVCWPSDYSISLKGTEFPGNGKLKYISTVRQIRICTEMKGKTFFFFANYLLWRKILELFRKLKLKGLWVCHCILQMNFIKFTKALHTMTNSQLL